jgi:hypothetical protein
MSSIACSRAPANRVSASMPRAASLLVKRAAVMMLRIPAFASAARMASGLAV